MVARVLPAQRDRAVAQRPDRCATVESGAAHLGRRDGGGCDGDARAGRHPDRLHGQQLPAARSPGAGRRDVRRMHANTLKIRLEYALVITFLYGQPYECNEYCKYYKNIENPQYKFIPTVHRTYYDGNVSHVTGIVNITAEEYTRCRRSSTAMAANNFPGVAESMDRFIDKIKQETDGEVFGELEIVRIPLNLYRARNATSRQWRSAAQAITPWPTRRCSSPATPRSGRLTSSRSRWASSARCSWRRCSRSATAGARDARPLRAVHVQAVASRLHAQQDDQAQQGPVRVGRRSDGAAGQAAHLLAARSRACASAGPGRRLRSRRDLQWSVLLLDAVILMGGRASRLDGAAKGDLRVEGRTLLERVVAAADPARDRVVVGEAGASVLSPEVRIVREQPPFGGPAAAVAAGVHELADDADAVLILAGDQPFVAEAVPLLLAALPAAEDGDGARAVDPDGRRST